MESSLTKAGYKTQIKTLEEYYESYGLEAPGAEDSDDSEEEEDEGDEGSEESEDESGED